MNLLEKIELLWTKETEKKTEDWVNALIRNKQEVVKASRKFHEWAPLHVYLSVTRAANPQVSFSLRYQGQEVASLAVNGDINLKISRENAKNNKKYFDIEKEGTFNWAGSDAAEFRKNFSLLDSSKKGRVTEHRIESEFLKQMVGTRSKFAGTLRDIRPVLLADCPFQFPLPISGNTGEPQPKKGNIDILARRGSGKGTRISIWELKKPETTAHAIEQAYIYAVTLINVLRSRSGGIWYKEIIGFGGAVPEKLIIESIVAVSIANMKKKSDFVKKVKKFKEENSLQVGNDTIKLYVAHYKENPLLVDLEEI